MSKIVVNNFPIIQKGMLYVKIGTLFKHWFREVHIVQAEQRQNQSTLFLRGLSNR